MSCGRFVRVPVTAYIQGFRVVGWLLAARSTHSRSCARSGSSTGESRGFPKRVVEIVQDVVGLGDHDAVVDQGGDEAGGVDPQVALTQVVLP